MPPKVMQAMKRHSSVMSIAVSMILIRVFMGCPPWGCRYRPAPVIDKTFALVNNPRLAKTLSYRQRNLKASLALGCGFLTIAGIVPETSPGWDVSPQRAGIRFDGVPCSGRSVYVMPPYIDRLPIVAYRPANGLPS